MDSLSGKIVLITGSSTGIGAASAVEFSRYGAKLMLTGRNEANLKKVEEECRKSGAEDVSYVVAELSNDEEVRKIVDDTMAKYNRLDVLVNNAGIGFGQNLEEMSMEQYDELFKINVRAPVLLTRLCIPHLKESKGNIVNVSSVYSASPCVMMGAYAMSKAALDMFTKVLTIELGHAGIRVNSVNPGIVKTEMVINISGCIEKYAALRSKCYPSGRLGDPVEVARVITFLASDAASFMTGSLTPIDGGFGVTDALSYEEMAELRNEDGQ